MSLKNIFRRLQDLDISALHVVNLHRARGLDGLFIFITDTAYSVALLIPLVMLLVATKRRNAQGKLTALRVLASLMCCSLVTTAFKYTIQRPRPFVNYSYIEKLSGGGSPSFPSGHTADAFAVVCALSLMANRHKWAACALWAWAFLVGYSRLALGVHYPSDVLASILIGLMCAVFTARALIHLQKRKEAAKQ